MKKYICSNCGFRSRLQTENVLTETGVKRHRCKNCGCRTISLVDETSQGRPCGGAIYRVIEKWNRRAGEQNE